MEPAKQDKRKRNSPDKMRLMALIFTVLFMCIAFVIGLVVVTQRISKMEELLQDLQSSNENCSQQKSGLREINGKQRARRDASPVTMVDVMNEIQAQLRSVTASQICSPPSKICLPGAPGLKGEQGLRGQTGEKGIHGPKGDPAFGPSGDPGSKGLRGPKGDMGIRGGKGDKGEKGERGMPGLSSPEGPSKSDSSLPTVYVTPNELNVVENAPATFRCIAIGKPIPVVVWERAGRGVMTIADGKLTIPRTKPEDAGKYVCRAFNAIGKAHATAKLIVQGMPVISNPTSKVKAKAYDDVTLFCHVNGIPRPTVHWVMPSNIPNDRLERRGDNLVIKQIRFEESGFYVCQATNAVGTVKMSVKVSVVPRTGKHRNDAVRNCKELKAQVPDAPCGIYWVDLDLGSPDNAFQTNCDQETEGGGWTLVWSYLLITHPKLFTPRPSFPCRPDVNGASISATPPLNESHRGALNFSLWKKVGREVLVKSTLYNWFVCNESQGSLVEFRDGSISCRLVKNGPPNVPGCNAYPIKMKTSPHYCLQLTFFHKYVDYAKETVMAIPGANHSVLTICDVSLNIIFYAGSWYIR